MVVDEDHTRVYGLSRMARLPHEIRDGDGADPCQACGIESEIGTEEVPHPIDRRLHTCSRRPPPKPTPVEAARAYCRTHSMGNLLARCGDGACVKCFGRHGSGCPWKCSREPGHDGDHVAIENGKDYAVAAQWENQRP